MTAPRDPDLLIRAFLDEGRTELPDRAYDAVRGQIDQTRQRVVIGPWREPSMSNTMRLAIAAAAVLVVALIGIQLLPGLGGGVGGPGSTASPTPTIVPTAAALATRSPEPPTPTDAGVPSPHLSAVISGLVTGQLTWDDIPEGTVEWAEGSVEVEGVLRERVRKRTAQSVMSDPRLTGTVTVTDNADRFVFRDLLVAGDVMWGTVAIENDEGTWTGTLTGTSDTSNAWAGISYIELVGAGAYEGLSAILFEREQTPTEPPEIRPLDWNGVIFSGDLPPNR